MQSKSFRFKQFSVIQHNSAMKVGTDGVLIGAWADAENTESILDIGSGTGLISLMACQRFPLARVTAVEQDADAANESISNVQNSRWAERVEVVTDTIQNFSEYHTGKFGLIISNPPFYNSQFRPIDKNRSNARHLDTLTFDELLTSAHKLLEDDGRFCTILPTEALSEIEAICMKLKLFIHKILYVHPTPDKAAKRILLSIAKFPDKQEIESMVVESHGRHQYSEEYKQLTKDFYLAF